MYRKFLYSYKEEIADMKKYQILEDYLINSQFPFDIENLVKVFNIEIRYEHMLEKGHIKYVDSNFIIIANKAKSQEINRFTIARELGHFLLNPDRILDNKKNDVMKNYWDVKADWFAYNILLPVEDIFEDYKHYLMQSENSEVDFIQLVAQKYGVSTITAQTRLESIGILK